MLHDTKVVRWPSPAAPDKGRRRVGLRLGRLNRETGDQDCKKRVVHPAWHHRTNRRRDRHPGHLPTWRTTPESPGKSDGGQRQIGLWGLGFLASFISCLAAPLLTTMQ